MKFIINWLFKPALVIVLGILLTVLGAAIAAEIYPGEVGAFMERYSVLVAIPMFILSWRIVYKVLTKYFPYINNEGIETATFTDNKSEGWIDPFMFHSALKSKAIELGAEFMKGEVKNLSELNLSTQTRVNIQNIETKGLMSYSIDGKEYMHELKQKFALLIQDSNKNTEIYGQFKITPEGNEKILWIGHFKVEGTNGFTYGFYWGKGENENEGKIIEWSFAEDPRNLSKNNKNPNIYLMSGIITDQPKDNL